LDGLIVPTLLLELPDPLHGQEPGRLLEPQGESRDCERRYGGEHVNAAPPYGPQQQRRKGRREQYADRPPALNEGVYEPPALPVTIELVEVGRIHRLLGVSETGDGSDDRQVRRRKRRGSQAREAGAY